jgi:hypothetical protein
VSVCLRVGGCLSLCRSAQTAPATDSDVEERTRPGSPGPFHVILITPLNGGSQSVSPWTKGHELNLENRFHENPRGHGV